METISAPKKHSARDALHSSATCEHGTPSAYVELARETLGAIDLDPFSSNFWNYHVVKAARFYDERMNGFEQPWFGRMLINPPGVARTGNVARAWRKLIDHYVDGRVDSAVWIGFSLEQLVELQAQPAHPLQFVTAIPSSRVEFLTRASSGPPIANPNPTHGAYVTLLQTKANPTHARDQVQRFIKLASAMQIGAAIIRPVAL